MNLWKLKQGFQIYSLGCLFDLVYKCCATLKFEILFFEMKNIIWESNFNRKNQTKNSIYIVNHENFYIINSFCQQIDKILFHCTSIFRR